jgi:hypothetical protein
VNTVFAVIVGQTQLLHPLAFFSDRSTIVE